MATRILTHTQKGLYIDLICLIWEKGISGTIEIQDVYLSVLWSMETSEAISFAKTLHVAGVINMEIYENTLKISQKRIAEDLRNLKINAKRQRKFRKSSNAHVTPMLHENNGKKAEGILQKADKRNLTKTPFWTEVCKHLEETWKRKKNAPFLFTGQRMKSLKGLCQTYQPWGVMALWDMFLVSDDPWIKDTGYKFEAFVHSVDKLVDNYSWKQKAQVYEAKLYNPVSALPAGSSPEVIKSALDSIIKRP